VIDGKKHKVLSHDGVTVDGFWLVIGFIEHSYRLCLRFTNHCHTKNSVLSHGLHYAT
jgi:hypothetical protein